MIRILSLDVATECGWAVIDPEKPISQIKLGHFRCVGATNWEKASSLRRQVREIRAADQSNAKWFACIETPFTMSPQYDKKPKSDLVSDTTQDPFVLGRQMIERLKTAVERGGLLAREVTDIIDAYFGEGKTINSKTTSLLNHLAGAAQGACEGMGMPYEFVRPITWRTILPPEIKAMNVDTKAKVRVLCDRWQIIGGDNNARDAAIQGVWCLRKSQIYKKFTNEVEQAGLF